MHAQTPVSEEYWFLARLSIGLFGLIFLPGLLFAIAVLRDDYAKAGFSFLFGFMLQLLNIFTIWIFHIFYGPVSFALLIYILTLIEIILIIVYLYRRKIILSTSKIIGQFKVDLVLVAVVVLYVAIALYWQQWAPSPHSDGAAYLDMARNVVEKGVFQSNMILPNNSWYYVEYSSGMHVHMFGYFAIALFFMLGNVSLFSAKIMLIFAGLLSILVLYELVKKLFNVNVARLAALIAAMSPVLLTHVGLVGGPEIPSALFILFTIYLLIYAPTSKRKVAVALMAGLSLFIAWYAWDFNFFVMLTFLPLLFIYIVARAHRRSKVYPIARAEIIPEHRRTQGIFECGNSQRGKRNIEITHNQIQSGFEHQKRCSNQGSNHGPQPSSGGREKVEILNSQVFARAMHKEFKITHVLLLLILLASFILEYRVLLNFMRAAIGVPIPSLVIATSIAIYLLRLRKSQNKNTLITFAMMLLALYLTMYSRVIASSFITQVQQFTSSVLPGMEVVTSNVARDVGVLSRAFSIEDVNKYWNIYWGGVFRHLSLLVVFLGIMSLVRIDKLKETLLIISFPLLQAVLWSLFSTIDEFQPRFIICSSLFYFILVASVFEMLCSYAAGILNIAKPISLQSKVGGVAARIRTKSFVKVLVFLLLFFSLSTFTNIIFSYHHQIMEYWNYPHNFAWNPAIEWIGANTRPDDVLMARQGNYWAWFTERKTVMFAPGLFGSVNDTQLTYFIGKFEVKYLIVDYRFYSDFPQLRKLYSEPQSFHGSQIVLQWVNEQGYKTIIYNVTNIAYVSS